MEKKMNERIKALAEQAGAYAESLVGNHSERAEFAAAFEQKFAELIVREAARFLAVNSGYDDCNNAWFPEPEDMLEHFGVEP
jgi:hypothetical protein